MLKKFLLLMVLLLPAALQASEEAALKTLQKGDYMLGKKDAPITVIEYASLSCPHCAAFHNDMLPEIKRDYIDTGKIRLIFRDFPLNRQAVDGAQLAHCAAESGGEQRYFEALKLLFSKQEEWAMTLKFQEKLIGYGKALSLEPATLQLCLGNAEIQGKILKTRLDAQNILKVDGTPFFFVNGKSTPPVLKVKTLRDALDAALAGKTPEEAREEATQKITVAQSADNVLGDSNAKVTVVEYVNIACPHCGSFHNKLKETLQKEYLDTGKVKLVFRELPMNQTSFYAYMLAHCKGADNFFKTVDMLIDNTSAWANTTAFLVPLRQLAEKHDIDKQAFYECMENKEAEKRILLSLEQAQEIGIDHSPALFINGERIGNTDDMDGIKKALDTVIAGKPLPAEAKAQNHAH